MDFNYLIFKLFYFMVPIFFSLSCWFNYYTQYVQDIFINSDPASEQYDFIVVGGGSAGCVVAARLSKNSRVLLIEAGGDPNIMSSIPGLTVDLLHNPEIDHMYQTVPQMNSKGLIDNVSKWPRGFGLGGSSQINYMVYVRSHPADFDNWANITKEPNWNYENVVKLYRKSAHHNEKYKINEKHYGSTGYEKLNIEERKWRPLYKYWSEAAQELGFSDIDVNGPQRSAVGIVDGTQKDGKRYGVYTGFIKNSKIDNLRIAKYSKAYKIQFDKNNRAIGIWFEQYGKKKFVRATKEIIISAGSIDSPKLLMLSGIGPKEHLKSMGIKVKADLPVGQNLQDHPFSIYMNVIINETISYISERDFGISTLTDYFLNGEGPLTSPCGQYGQLFYTTKEALKENNNVDWPDMQIFLLGVGNSLTSPEFLSRGFNLKLDVLKKFQRETLGKDGLMAIVIGGRPKSRGFINLKSKDPKEHPIIDPKYLENPYDLRVLVDALKFMTKMIETTKTFQKLNARLSNVHFPGCEEFKFKSDEYWECYVRHLTFTTYHPAGTCKMGLTQDKSSVVDPKLRVLRTKGLRVADASIMPHLVNGNTNAATIMIGEQAANFIREHWAQQLQVSHLFYRTFLSKSHHTMTFLANNYVI